MDTVNGKSIKQITIERDAADQHARMIAKQYGRQSPEVTAALAAVDELSNMLRAAADAAYDAMTPVQRRQHHIAQGLIPYDESLYTDEATRQWSEKNRTKEHLALVATVVLDK